MLCLQVKRTKCCSVSAFDKLSIREIGDDRDHQSILLYLGLCCTFVYPSPLHPFPILCHSFNSHGASAFPLPFMPPVGSPQQCNILPFADLTIAFEDDLVSCSIARATALCDQFFTRSARHLAGIWTIA